MVTRLLILTEPARHLTSLTTTCLIPIGVVNAMSRNGIFAQIVMLWAATSVCPTVTKLPMDSLENVLVMKSSNRILLLPLTGHATVSFPNSRSARHVMAMAANNAFPTLDSYLIGWTDAFAMKTIGLRT